MLYMKIFLYLYKWIIVPAAATCSEWGSPLSTCDWITQDGYKYQFWISFHPCSNVKESTIHLLRVPAALLFHPPCRRVLCSWRRSWSHACVWWQSTGWFRACSALQCWVVHAHHNLPLHRCIRPAQWRTRSSDGSALVRPPPRCMWPDPACERYWKTRPCQSHRHSRRTRRGRRCRGRHEGAPARLSGWSRSQHGCRTPQYSWLDQLRSSLRWPAGWLVADEDERQVRACQMVVRWGCVCYPRHLSPFWSTQRCSSPAHVSAQLTPVDPDLSRPAGPACRKQEEIFELNCSGFTFPTHQLCPLCIQSVVKHDLSS